jgi:hypothetical protein
MPAKSKLHAASDFRWLRAIGTQSLRLGVKRAREARPSDRAFGQTAQQLQGGRIDGVRATQTPNEKVQCEY